MGMYAVQTADTGELAALREVAGHGRAVAMARRRALATGRSGLGPAQERVRTGTRSAELRDPAATADASPAPPAEHDAPHDARPATSGAPVAASGVAASQLGRTLSMQRRRQLSQGKHALSPAAGADDAAPSPDHVDDDGSCREQARARRASASRFGSAVGRTSQGQGPIPHAPKVVAATTQGGQQVTGVRIGPGARVTGGDVGALLPVSGTQYVASGSATRPGAGTKVALVRTAQGLLVSGTAVRNKVRITGDEAGEHLAITGEADQKLDDDLTPRADATYGSTQFPRRADPHGASAVAAAHAAFARLPSDRRAGGTAPLEATDRGLAVTGTAVGRSGRVTGNQAGACRPVTGDQYDAPPSHSTDCGGTGGGTAPAAHLDVERLDPVTGGKVTVAQTWGGQRITGPSVEYRPTVTGDEPGVCRPVTGTPYQGPSTAFGWCEPLDSAALAERLEPGPLDVAVTGDVPMHTDSVTGTERGHGRTLTGTPYYGVPRTGDQAVVDVRAVSPAFPVALARRPVVGAGAEERASTRPLASSIPGRITGAFAIGDGKVTGNHEFLFRARSSGEAKPSVVTGEGRTEGPAITGSAWTAHDRVTGTEGHVAAARNPSQGGGRPHGWAGATRFGERATPEDPRQIVTGLSGWSPKAAAKITLSGGAQG